MSSVSAAIDSGACCDVEESDSRDNHILHLVLRRLWLRSRCRLSVLESKILAIILSADLYPGFGGACGDGDCFNHNRDLEASERLCTAHGTLVGYRSSEGWPIQVQGWSNRTRPAPGDRNCQAKLDSSYTGCWGWREGFVIVLGRGNRLFNNAFLRSFVLNERSLVQPRSLPHSLAIPVPIQMSKRMYPAARVRSPENLRCRPLVWC
jgi:hypothetical protein